MTDDPYHDGGTRGSSGPASSTDAARADLVQGITNATQRYVVIMAAQAGARGVTVAELREKSGSLHHGRISSAMTKQHIAGRLVALTERRGNAGVYVLPEHVGGREVRPYRQQNRRLTVDEVYGLLTEHQILNGIAHAECACGDVTVRNRTEHRQHVARVIVGFARDKQDG